MQQFIQETQDRLAIRELIDQYAYCADTFFSLSPMRI